MTQTQTNKTDLQQRFDRNFPTIERAYNLRRKKDTSLPSLMQKDGFVHPIALEVIEKMYAENKQDEVTEPHESNEQLQILEEANEKLQSRLNDLLNRITESKTERIQISKQLTETENKLSEKVQIVSELQNRLSESQKLKTELSEKVQIVSDATQTDKQIISELYEERAELQNQADGKDFQISELQTQIDELQTRKNSFVEKLKSETITVIGLFFSIAYQGFHSERFFFDRYSIKDVDGNIIANADDWKNLIISTCAAIAFSIAGFKLTLHSRNQGWIYGIATIDFLIYCTPKDLNFANILAGFAIATSIVVYSHILQASNSTK